MLTTDSVRTPIPQTSLQDGKIGSRARDDNTLDHHVPTPVIYSKDKTNWPKLNFALPILNIYMYILQE